MSTTSPEPPTGDQPALLLPAHLEHFRRRVLYDGLLQATSDYWQRRAGMFAAVGTPDCDEIAQACRNHATFLTTTGLDAQSLAVIEDIVGALEEVPT